MVLWWCFQFESFVGTLKKYLFWIIFTALAAISLWALPVQSPAVDRTQYLIEKLSRTTVTVPSTIVRTQIELLELMPKLADADVDEESPALVVPVSDSI